MFSVINSSAVVDVANITGNSRQWYIGFSSNNNNNNAMARGPVLMPAHFMSPMMSFGAVKYSNTRPSAKPMGQGWYRHLCARYGALPDASCIEFLALPTAIILALLDLCGIKQTLFKRANLCCMSGIVHSKMTAPLPVCSAKLSIFGVS